MSVFPILDLVIGMIFIYFLLSIVCSSAVELWLTVRRTRARILENWLKAIFNLQALDAHGLPMIDEKGKPISVGKAIIDHCMVTALSPRGKSNSYLSDVNFTTALLDKISITNERSENLNFVLPPLGIKGYIEQIKKTEVISAELKRVFLMFAYEAEATKVSQGSFTSPSATANAIAQQMSGTSAQTQLGNEVEYFRDKLGNWYNLNQDRLTGTLKRKALPATIIVAIALTIGLNINSITIGKYFYHHKEELAEFAELASRGINVANLTGRPNIVLNPELPWGWGDDHNSTNRVFGWLVTTLAIIIGAPFWFDVLNKLVNLRTTGPKPSQDSSGRAQTVNTTSPLPLQMRNPKLDK
ncbi:hypothetical protein HRG84_13450 [Flavisolibacter sp. BT320]|nr:hypothetical protein [Flavisolibacter longurius]